MSSRNKDKASQSTLDATRVHLPLNVRFCTTSHRLNRSHVMSPIVPRDPLFQKSSHKDRGGEITSGNLEPSDINDTKKHHLKKLSLVLDYTHSMPLLSY